MGLGASVVRHQSFFVIAARMGERYERGCEIRKATSGWEEQQVGILEGDGAELASFDAKGESALRLPFAPHHMQRRAVLDE